VLYLSDVMTRNVIMAFNGQNNINNKKALSSQSNCVTAHENNA